MANRATKERTLKRSRQLILPGVSRRLRDFEDRFSPDFFKTLPKSAGVYRFLSEKDEILYVGKAKNIRQRLLSYRRVARGLEDNRKLQRLLIQTHRIEWEELPSEEEALLQENRLLRKLKPSFNRVNTRPENYYVLESDFGGARGHVRFSLRLARELDCFRSSRQRLVVGTFKGRRRLQEGVRILQIWTRLMEETCRMDSSLSKPLQRQDLHKKLRAFLRGTSATFLKEADRYFSELKGFEARVRSQEREILQELYTSCFQRNARIKKLLKMKSVFIPAVELDDAVVKLRFQIIKTSGRSSSSS